MSTNCPNCAEPLGERGFFCKVCASQARCMKCRELLEPDAAACVECGTRMGQDGEGSKGTRTGREVTPISPNRNSLTYHEDRNSRKFEASLTDSAMHGLGAVFEELFAQRGVGRTVQPAGQRTSVRAMTIDESKHLSPTPPLEAEQPPIGQTPPAPKADPERERVLKIFRLEGKTLELSENRLKAKSAADYYKRLAYLVIYAHEIVLGETSAPKAEVIEVLKAAKVYDANCRFWLKQRKGFTVDTEDRMKLIAGAKEQAIKAVIEVLDSNVADGWNPDTRTAKARGPRKKK
jgi:hypothetical protein